MGNLQKVVYLTEAQAQTLFTNGTITVDGVTVTYSADDLYVTPQDAPVTDVQVNGTSVLSNGVANIPVTDGINPGVIIVRNGNDGLKLDSNNRINIEAANSTRIKSGEDNYRPITTYRQHESAFYGLAKVAGDSTQSASSNAVGTYTDAAKIAIQKMLGIYEAPWELIKEETFTNAESADHHITTDSNSSPFELSDVILHLSIPSQNNEASVGNYGLVNMHFGDGTYDYYQAELGAKTLAANSSTQYAFIKLEQSQKMRMLEFNKWTSSGNYTATCRQSASYNSVAAAFSVYTNPTYVKDILIKSVLGTMTYRLYGKRKWT